MIRLLVIVIVIALMLAAVRQLMRPRSQKQSAAPKRLVKCAHCGVYVTEDLAVKDGEDCFCSEQHRRDFMRRGSA